MIIAQRWEDLEPVIEELERRGYQIEAHINEPWNPSGYRGIHATKRVNGYSMEIQLSTPEHWKLKEESQGVYSIDRSPEWEKMTPEEREAVYGVVRGKAEEWAALGRGIPEPVRRWMHEHSVE